MQQFYKPISGVALNLVGKLVGVTPIQPYTMKSKEAREIIIMLFFIFVSLPRLGGLCYVSLILPFSTHRPGDQEPHRTKLFMHFPLIYSHIPFKALKL